MRAVPRPLRLPDDDGCGLVALAAPEVEVEASPLLVGPTLLLLPLLLLPLLPLLLLSALSALELPFPDCDGEASHAWRLVKC